MLQDSTQRFDISISITEDGGSIEKLKDKFREAMSVLAAYQIALWEYNIQTKECSFTDDYFRILGLDKVGIYYRNLEEFYQFVHPDDLHLVSLDDFQKKLACSDLSSVLRVRCVGSQGEIVWLEDHLFSLQKDKDGNPERLSCYAVNVTRQCEREAHIWRLEERNRKVIEALPDFIFIFDDKFFITDVLMAPNTTLLHSVEQLRGINGRDIYSPAVCDLFLQNIHQCLKDGGLREIEYPLDVENQGRFYFQARIAPFEDNKVLALIHDISDRVHSANELVEAKRRAEETDRMKSVFLANMSHEIRTPLNAIVGFSEIIALAESEAEKNEYLAIIQQNSNLLLQLINDILDLSRIESGGVEMNFQLTEMNDLVEEVGKVHRLKIKDGIRFEVLHPHKKVWFMIDRNRITQVLFNFLSNAIKNTHQGSITMGLKVEGSWLKLYVTDTGCGISEEKMPLIFNRFEKLNDFVQGTGLGLPICQSIVDRLGGRINVESKIGVGSTFSVYLPYRKLQLNAEGKVIEVATDGMNQPDGRKKILIAEGSEVNFIQISSMLKNDYTISWVTNGEEAVDSFLRERPDLILMDIHMPVMNGLEATEKIRAVSTNLPIIAVTSHALYIEKQQALAAGCNDLIVRPYTLEQLKETIEKYL